MNYSKQREKIIETLKNNPIHPTAEEMLELLKKNNSDVGFTTLYRNLNMLSEKGIIRRIDGLSLGAHFDYNTSEHYHFICEKCHKVYDVPKETAPNIKNNACKITRFDIKSYDIVFHGICCECKRKEK